MNHKEKSAIRSMPSTRDLALSSLERDQLTGATRRHFPRRKLKAPQLAVLWLVRLYLIFMLVVVGYQVWSAGR
ncbi:MAG TPA: hypothetical protein VKZ53_08390 [Candidatus Angelobacter sp.]|nr:hypothetical protein [Candidatus Angelobacter sp.]